MEHTWQKPAIYACHMGHTCDIYGDHSGHICSYFHGYSSRRTNCCTVAQNAEKTAKNRDFVFFDRNYVPKHKTRPKDSFSQKSNLQIPFFLEIFLENF